LWAREPSGFLSCSQRFFDGMWWLLVLGAAQELGLGSPLVADDECAAASGTGAGACAASALQRHARASASESESERAEMPPWWMMGLPPPWLQQPMQPMQPMPPMPPMQPMQPMYPWMRPMQPQYPTAQPAAQPATTAQPTAPRKAYLPLFPNGWGMIADEEGQELAQLTTSREHCEDACTATVGCNSFVFCTFGGCYLKTAQFVGQESTHYSGLCSTFWTPSQSSVSGSTTLPPLQQVETKQCSKGQVPEPLGGCGTSSEPTLMTFYQYRAQSGVVPKNRLWENINLANIGGVMFYLHNEVVDKDGEMRDTENQRTTKFQVDRVMRFKVTMKNSEALWKKFRAQFGQFIQFDYGQATFGMPDHVQKCNAIWSDFGYEVGCQHNPTGISGYDEGYWTSWPGRCPSMPFTDKAPQGGPAKTEACLKEQPGGACGSPDGSFDCTWHIEEAGFVMLDELVGVDIKELYKNGGTQYEKSSDAGEGVSFWNGKKDKAKCKEREDKLLNLFANKYRDQPASLTDPACDFWR
ncbi:unnamed protein product, partial [Effrenium voratum]